MLTVRERGVQRRIRRIDRSGNAQTLEAGLPGADPLPLMVALFDPPVENDVTLSV
jgi:hypothetical protein